MYNIGICDDGENICASVENMLLKYAEKKAVQVDVQVWYTGETKRLSGEGKSSGYPFP